MCNTTEINTPDMEILSGILENIEEEVTYKKIVKNIIKYLFIKNHIDAISSNNIRISMDEDEYIWIEYI